MLLEIFLKNTVPMEIIIDLLIGFSNEQHYFWIGLLLVIMILTSPRVCWKMNITPKTGNTLSWSLKEYFPQILAADTTWYFSYIDLTRYLTNQILEVDQLLYLKFCIKYYMKNPRKWTRK